MYGILVISMADNFLRPMIIGSRAKLNTLFLLLCITGGIVVFGFSGIIIGPLTLAIFLSFVEIYRERYLGIESTVN